MTKHQALQLFEDKKVRAVWDTEQEKWYFSIIDVVLVLTESANPKQLLESFKKQIKKRRKSVGYKL